MTGHLLGAAGGLETIVCALVADTGDIPPTINIVDQDPECDLNVTANIAGRFDGEYVLNNNFGFGGTNGCLILRKL
jgi:3-oxoacyl-[acyl-carrier-protein] synthase II